MNPSLAAAWPAYGLAALVLLAPLSDGGTTYLPATLIRLASLALALAWLVSALRHGGRWRAPTPLDLPVVLFITLAAVSTLLSSSPYRSLQAFLGLATGALLLAVAAEAARAPRVAPLLVHAVALGALGQAALVLAQWATGADRPAGSYFNPNHAALAMAMGLAILLAARPEAVGARWAAWGGAALLATAVVLTRSRGGLLAAAAGVVVAGWSRWRWRVPAAALAVSVLLLVVPNPLHDRLRDAHARDPVAYARVWIWASAVERALDHPLGVGLNLFRQTSQQYAFPVEDDLARYGRRAESAHNDYLEILAELGFPGLALALWALGALALRARARLSGHGAGGGGHERPVVLGASGALAAMAAQALVDSPLSVPGLVVQAAVLCGILVAAPGAAAAAEGRAAPGSGPAVTGSRRVLSAALALAFLLGAFGVARHGAAYLCGREAARARDAGDPRAARLWLRRAAWLVPESPGYRDSLGAAAAQAWRRSKDAADAVAAEQGMLQAIALEPGNAERYARLAEVYREVVPLDPPLRRATLERARALYLRAEALDPYAVVYPFARAQVEALLGRRDAEIAALERAVALEPHFLPARLRLARLHALAGRRGPAREHYAALVETLEAYERQQAAGRPSVFARSYLAVDREVARREAAEILARSS